VGIVGDNSYLKDYKNIRMLAIKIMDKTPIKIIPSLPTR
jgi:hypothetical protein